MSHAGVASSRVRVKFIVRTTRELELPAVAMIALQRFTLTYGREERFPDCDAGFPPARNVHSFP